MHPGSSTGKIRDLTERRKGHPRWTRITTGEEKGRGFPSIRRKKGGKKLYSCVRRGEKESFLTLEKGSVG